MSELEVGGCDSEGDVNAWDAVLRRIGFKRRRPRPGE